MVFHAYGKKLLKIFIFISLIPIYVNAQVIITEIMYDPIEKKDSGYEWIEISVNSKKGIDITELRFREGGTNHLIENVKGKSILKNGEVSVIVQDENLFLEAYPNYVGSIFKSKFSLRQKGLIGEKLGIYNPKDKELLFSIEYQPKETANGSGASIHIVDGNQIVAPPTPGHEVVNPIPIESLIIEDGEEGAEEIVVEEKEIEKIEVEKISEPVIEKPKPKVEVVEKVEIKYVKEECSESCNKEINTDKISLLLMIIILELLIIIIPFVSFIKKSREDDVIY